MNSENLIGVRIRCPRTLAHFRHECAKRNLSAGKLANMILDHYFDNNLVEGLESYPVRDVPPRKKRSSEKRQDINDFAQTAMDTGAEVVIIIKRPSPVGRYITEDYLAVPDESPSEGMGK